MKTLVNILGAIFGGFGLLLLWAIHTVILIFSAILPPFHRR